MLPYSLVFGVVYHFWRPRTFILWVINHWRLPFSIIFFVPFFWLFSIRVWNFFRNIIVAFRFDILWIGNLFLVNPVLRLRHTGIVNFLVLKEIKFILKLSL